MGLKLKLRPFEKFVVNGVVIENGSHRNTLTVANHAQVMTGRSILQAEEATTPVKRTYYAIQAMLIDPAGMEGHRRTYEPLIAQVVEAIREPGMARHLRDAAGFVDTGDHYKALAALRPVIAYEALLLEAMEAAARDPAPPAADPVWDGAGV
ncbi:MAG: putative flagellum biosynthesis repressor protein FlbT [Pseudomonadota bacterium]|jgi:flagellar protein FlbT